MFSKLKSFFAGRKLDVSGIAELEETLVSSDVSHDIAAELVKAAGKHSDASGVREALKAKMLEILAPAEAEFAVEGAPFSLVLVGVNGGGKTTTAGKLAHKFTAEGKQVSLVACDTFRASAIEQLGEWAERAGARFVSKPHADPSGLAYDGMKQAVAAGDDIVIFDTAGRLANNGSLMDELGKTVRSIGKVQEGAPSLVLLVLDAGGGQNSIAQYEKFSAALPFDGVIITKTDGTAKGGFLLALSRSGAKIFFEAYGEGAADIRTFSAKKLVEKIFA
ncbi:MAG: signal recognition particle-docking protein FtsY [Rickettsiales bacterium]|jgi:fused signal recognition particle receptor|nr:signal recognition particle-docking protein FtsY [Rickettsiales bacterium]